MAKSVFFFGDGHPEGDPKRRDLLGGKGAGLAEMTALGLPVPPGFTIATTVCNAFAASQSIPDELAPRSPRRSRASRRRWGLASGDPAAPLLVSVRSGARASMPGMMDTILNLGLNDAVAEGLAARTKSTRFAFDAYRRFVAMHASIALGVSREPFEHALDETRARVAAAKGVDRTRLNAEELKRARPRLGHPGRRAARRSSARSRPSSSRRRGATSRATRAQQLWQAIEAVFKSWNNHRAVVYRRMHDIPDDWGTACNVQAMVFGNLGDTSATGVAFTRDPSTGEKKLYGEWLPNAQGEDVVAGIRTPHADPGQRPRARTTRSRRRCPTRTASCRASRRRSRSTSATCRTWSSRSRTASSTCSSAAPGSARRAPRSASRSTWRTRGSSPRKRPCCASIRAASISSFTRRSIRRRRRSSSRAASRRARARRAGTSSSAPTRPSGAPGRASPSSSCASRRRPRTSTG